MLTPIKRVGAGSTAITGNENSTLGTEADITLDAGRQHRSLPTGLAPTASTAAAMALGDALAMAPLEARGFYRRGLRAFPSGGSLGRRLLTMCATSCAPAPPSRPSRRRDGGAGAVRDYRQRHGHDGGRHPDGAVAASSPMATAPPSAEKPDFSAANWPTS